VERPLLVGLTSVADAMSFDDLPGGPARAATETAEDGGDQEHVWGG
jgi:hypothetical protein